MVRAARTLVIVDDECSTGNTYVAVANAMMEVMPHLELIATCCITDWRGGDYIRNMPRPTLPVSLISGSMRSEEHTSELQSLMRTSYAVFCLKKQKSSTKHTKKKTT